MQVILPLALFLIMFGIGLSLTTQDFARLTKQPKAVLAGVLLQLLGLPLLCLLVVTVFQLSAEISVALLVLSFAPGGATSNMISYLSKADTALSVSLTALTSFITPFTLPFYSVLAASTLLGISHSMEYPLVTTIIKLLVVSVIPVLLGMWVLRKVPTVAKRLQRFVKMASLAFMIFVVVGIVMQNSDKLAGLTLDIGPIVILLASLAMLLGWYVAKALKLTDEQGITLAIETGIQNAGMALLITEGLLQNSFMSGVVLLYGVLMQIPAIIIILYRNRRDWFGRQSIVR